MNGDLLVNFVAWLVILLFGMVAGFGIMLVSEAAVSWYHRTRWNRRWGDSSND